MNNLEPKNKFRRKSLNVASNATLKFIKIGFYSRFYFFVIVNSMGFNQLGCCSFVLRVSLDTIDHFAVEAYFVTGSCYVVL